MKPLIPSSKTWKFTPALYAAVMVAWAAYAMLMLMAPSVNESSYSLTNVQILLLRLSVVVPVLVIWLVAARGAVSFKQYAMLIKGSPEARSLNTIANGLIWSVAYLVTLVLFNPLEQYITGSHWLWLTVALNTYPALVLALIAFIFLYLGSQQLGVIAKFVTWTRGTWLLGLLYGVFCGLFAYVFYLHPFHDTSRATQTLVTNVISPELLVLTVILPYLLCWFLGFLTSSNILRYARHVPGVIYRQALTNLVRGILSIVGFAIIVQAVSLVAPLLTKVELALVLLFLYVIVLLYALGFLFIASGAKSLARIEAAE